MYELYTLANVSEWSDLLPEVDHDVYFTPEYSRIFEENGDGFARLFVYKNMDGIIIYPFLKKKIDMPFADIADDYFDIASPYGYGGPVCSEQNGKYNLYNEFRIEFSRFCKENNIISEFIRFHPILSNHRFYEKFMDVSFNRNTAYIDLVRTEDEIWQNISSKHRNSIRKAANNGLTVEKVNINEINLDKFHDMYIKTMKKNNAQTYYFFDKNFFYNTLSYLKDFSSLFFAKLNEKIISGVLLLHYGKYLHYHFNASYTEYLDYAPNNLLIYEIALWGKQQGYEIFHLGGGYSSNEDSLLRFKKNFSKGKLLNFYTGKTIHQSEMYSKLCSKWAEYNGVCDKEFNCNFFPLYRYKY